MSARSNKGLSHARSSCVCLHGAWVASVGCFFGRVRCCVFAWLPTFSALPPKKNASGGRHPNKIVRAKAHPLVCLFVCFVWMHALFSLCCLGSHQMALLYPSFGGRSPPPPPAWGNASPTLRTMVAWLGLDEVQVTRRADTSRRTHLPGSLFPPPYPRAHTQPPPTPTTTPLYNNDEVYRSPRGFRLLRLGLQRAGKLSPATEPGGGREGGQRSATRTLIQSHPATHFPSPSPRPSLPHHPPFPTHPPTSSRLQACAHTRNTPLPPIGGQPPLVHPDPLTPTATTRTET